MTTQLTASEELGYLLSDAYGQHAMTAIVPPELEPRDVVEAYAAQRAFLKRRRYEIGGWKIGSKSEQGPIQGAPLPLRGLYPNSATLPSSQFAVLGVELEIVFCFDTDLGPGARGLSEDDLLDRISSMAASIEIVSSRLAGWPDVPKLSQLADLQNHGALIVGEFVDYDADFEFRSPYAQVRFNGQEIFNGSGSNPAGDPRRLLKWLAGHCEEQGLVVPAGTLITTGSYTGMYFPPEPGAVVARIGDLPPIQFELT